MVIALVRPRIHWIPSGVDSLGHDAVEWARRHGFGLDPEQELVLEGSLGVREDGRWSPFEVGFNAPRQNGKGEVLMARELYGLYELGERFIVHSAHEFKTSERHFQRVEAAIRRSPELLAQVKRSATGRVIGFRYSHGDEAIELQDGRRIEFRTRTKSGMRGFDDVALLVLDEAMIFSEAAHGAMLPTVRASTAERGPQLWYCGSAADQMFHDHATVWARVRERGRAGVDDALAYFEWSLDYEHPDEVPDEVLNDASAWRSVNWAIERGRVLEEHMAHEQRSLAPRQFAVELLGVGDWPATEEAESVIDMDLWRNELADAASTMVGGVVFAFAVKPDRKQGAIGVAGTRRDGKAHVEIVEHRSGTGWMIDRLAELVQKHETLAVYCDERSPAGSLLPGFADVGVEVATINGAEYARACGMFLDRVNNRGLRHLGTTELLAAVKGATQRTLGDAWAWARKSTMVDVTPLEAVTVALWGLASVKPEPVYRSGGWS